MPDSRGLSPRAASNELPARTIGIDLGDRESSYCVMGTSGELIVEGKVRTTRTLLVERFGNEPKSRVVVEASSHSQWVARCLADCGHEVIVANPRHVHLISKSERKCDRNDARLLARIGRVDPELLRPVAPRTEQSFKVRTLLGARSQLVATRTRLINSVRTETKVVGGRIPDCWPESFHRRARAHLPENLRSILEPLLDVLREIQERIHAYDKEVERLSREQFPVTKLLRQVHGVGPLIALTFVATIDDPKRFSSSRSLGCYLGLVPRSHQSGSRNPGLRISKAGDGTLRRLLVSAAAYILRSVSPDCDLKRHGQKLARGGSSHDKGRARIAVARKLAVLLHRLWITGEVYDPLYAAKRAA